ncbi:MAG TPA: DUF192 domain-containing protein [Candidatus Sulfotelmatobacter sp.]|nr:DUF192 domain-containing protein [Candidatus Sulfotelmatobacter sp.]
MAVFSSSGQAGTAQAFNQTRQVYLAREVALANTHWARLRGLLGTSPDDFRNGRGLWIVPCHGVHTLAMGFAIDVVYLDRDSVVIHIEHGLRPWRFAPVRGRAASVLELPSQSLTQTGTEIGDKIEMTLAKDGDVKLP